MNSLTHRAVLTAVFTLGTFIFGFAQSPASGDSLILSRGILLIVVFLLLGFVLLIAEKLLQIQAMRSGANDLSRYSIFPQISKWFESKPKPYVCLLYTSDAADERSSVDLGGRRIIKKKKNIQRKREHIKDRTQKE